MTQTPPPSIATQLHDWTPTRLLREDGVPMVDWCYAGDRRFSDPFWEQTTGAMLARPLNQVFGRKTPLSTLIELSELADGVEPKGFIFHLARCGSTLVSQQLASIPTNIVLSEPTPVDHVLTTRIFHPDVRIEEQVRLLRAMISVLFRPRHSERAGYIKFDSWHTLFLPIIRQAFPEVPMIFLYRDPTEILISHLRMPGMQMIAGSMAGYMLGIDLNTALQLTQEQYYARVLDGIAAAVMEPLDERMLLVNYTELPQFTWTELPKHFNFALSAEEREIMITTSQRDAKQPQSLFVSDTTEKQQRITPAIREAVDTYVGRRYEKLEQLRLQQHQR